MSYSPPARRKADPLAEALDIGVKFPPGLVKALDALTVAIERDRQARAIAVGRKTLDEEWLEAQSEHDLAQAAKVDPADFTPYGVARPDVGHLQALHRSTSKAGPMLSGPSTRPPRTIQSSTWSSRIVGRRSPRSMLTI